MTSREEFEAWFNGAEFNAEYYPTEMYLAWQARGEVDDKRIAELEALAEQPKEWQELTDDEIHEQIESASIPQYQGMDVTATNLIEFARAIEAKLKDMNT